MFGFGKKKIADTAPSNQKRSSADKDKINDQLAKLGIIGIPGIDGDDADNISDGDLEDELMNILGEEELSSTEDKELQQLLQEDEPPVPPKRKNHSPVKPDKVSNSVGRQTGVSRCLEVPFITPPDKETAALQTLVEPSISAIPNSNSTEDIFKAPPPPSSVIEALQQRLERYKSEADKAQNAGDTSKTRRMGRIVKQYEDAMKSHQRGKPVFFDELPAPPGFAPIPYARPASPKPPTSVSSSTSNNNFISPAPELPRNLPEVSAPQRLEEPITVADSPQQPQANSGQDELLHSIYAKERACKEAALQAKRSGQLEQAKEFLKLAKAFGKVISDYQNGQQIDLSTIPCLSDLNAGGAHRPTPPPKPVPTSDDTSAVSINETFGGGVREHQTLVQAVTLEDTNVFAEENIFKAPPPPTTIMEALEQRLEKYKAEVEKGKVNSDGGKTRRMGRIVKQYEDAISAHKRGKPVDFDELPTPPGFAPIPVNRPAQSAAAAGLACPSSVPSASTSTQDVSPSDFRQKPTPPKQQSSVNRGENKPGTKLTLQEKQLNTILTRQRQFREAALNAKQRGDLEQAKEFLRTAKGFDKLIGVSQGGLPVDMSTLPSTPESVAALETEDFELVSSSDCLPATGSTAEIFTKLEADLREQMTVCMRTRDHLKTIGDIGAANRFEKMAIESKKDLDALRLAVKKESAIPKYHYETKIFSITECNSDLGEDDIEISILKGISFKTTDDADTFVRVELPYPSAEEAQSNKTAVVKNSNNPDYNVTYKMSINRGARNFPRFVHRHGFKVEVWSKGGLFRGNTLIGVATVKLTPLETKCTLHDAFDIMDGRKAVGKIEVKVRLRDPVLTKEITQKKQKWLSIDRV